MKVLQKMDLIPLLKNLHGDSKAKSQAQFYLNKAFNNRYGASLVNLSSVMANESKPFTDRQLAGIFIKGLINENDSVKLQQWLKCDFSIKEQIRAHFVETIRSSFKEMARIAFEIIVSYGAADISMNELTLFTSLISLVNSPGTLDEAKALSLEALGYLCEALEASSPQSISLVNQLLSAVFNPSNEVLRVSSLPTIRKIHSLYGASLSPDLEGQVSAFLHPANASVKASAKAVNRNSGTPTTAATSVPVASKLTDLYKLFLKDDSFLPDFVEVFTETKVTFRNEDRCTHLIECKGNLLFTDLVIPSRGEKAFVFALPGRYELSGQNKSAMKCIVEVKNRDPPPSAGGRPVYFPTAKDREKAASAAAAVTSAAAALAASPEASLPLAKVPDDKENSSTVVNGSSEESSGRAAVTASLGEISGVGRGTGNSSSSGRSSKKKSGNNTTHNNNNASTAAAAAGSSANQVLRVNSSSGEEQDDLSTVKHRMMNSKKAAVSAPTANSKQSRGIVDKRHHRSEDEQDESGEDEDGNLKMQRMRMKATSVSTSSSSVASTAAVKNKHHATNKGSQSSKSETVAVAGDFVSTKAVAASVPTDKHKPTDSRAKHSTSSSSTAVSSAATAAAPPKRIIRVWIQDYTFSTESVTLVAGQTVEFKLANDVPNHAEHSLIGTSSNPLLRFESHVLQQSSEGGDAGGQTPRCSSFSFVPTVPGEVLVSCAIYSDMQCLVTVISLDGIQTSNNHNSATPNKSTSKSVSSTVSFHAKLEDSVTASSLSAATGVGSGPLAQSSSPSSTSSSAEKKMKEAGLLSLNVGHFTTASRGPHSRGSGAGSAAESSGQSSFYDSDDVFSDEVTSENDDGLRRNTAVSQRLTYSTVVGEGGAVASQSRSAGCIGLSDPPEGTKRHFINVEEFKFSPTSLVMRVNEEVLFRLFTSSSSSATSTAPLSSIEGGLTITCEGEFEEVRLRPSSGGAAALEAGSYFLHRFTRVGAFEVKNDIFRFMGCHILVSALEFASGSSGAAGAGHSPPSYKSSGYSGGAAPRLMGSFTMLNHASANGTSTSAPPPVPVFNRPITTERGSESDDGSDCQSETEKEKDSTVAGESPAVQQQQQQQQLSPVATRVMASADFSCDIESSDSEKETMEEEEEKQQQLTKVPAAVATSSSQPRLSLSELVMAESPSVVVDKQATTSFTNSNGTSTVNKPQKSEKKERKDQAAQTPPPPTPSVTSGVAAMKASRPPAEVARVEQMVSDIVGSMLSGHPLTDSHITRNQSSASTPLAVLPSTHSGQGTVVILEGSKESSAPVEGESQSGAAAVSKSKRKKNKKKKKAAAAAAKSEGTSAAEGEEGEEEQGEDEEQQQQQQGELNEAPSAIVVPVAAVAPPMEMEKSVTAVQPPPSNATPLIGSVDLVPDLLSAEWQEALAAVDRADCMESFPTEVEEQEEAEGDFVSNNKKQKKKKDKKTPNSTTTGSTSTAPPTASAAPAPPVAATVKSIQAEGKAPKTSLLEKDPVVPASGGKQKQAKAQAQPAISQPQTEMPPLPALLPVKQKISKANSNTTAPPPPPPHQGCCFEFTENEADKAVEDFLRQRMRAIQKKKEDVLPSGRKVKVVHLVVRGKK